MSNLARLYDQVGEQELSEQYAARVRLFRRQNPYYLYHLAEQAYAEADYEEAEHLLNMAILRNSHEHEFYRLMGLSQLSRGDVQKAEESFRKAAEIAEGEEQDNYNRKLDMLATNAGAQD